MSLLSLLTTFALLTAGRSPAPADLILYNGKVVTVDGRFSIRQALAVKEGRILAVGSSKEVLKRKAPQTRLIDLQGKTVLPGLIDSHTHPTAASMVEFDHAIP